ncbi:TrkH family potassium uptake protein [Sediminitomix flava]|uniref:Potassium uptake TrkH family protein n=1 Tax=Sediminitomix flava TaxID=379075 RepID=A0A315Z658_SEDFL|nr:potassium transporter TrkG [Sediminitomix flava]PWJ39144.1 potassium uptake TrkH family protein [Sediminitomix flava]
METSYEVLRRYIDKAEVILGGCALVLMISYWGFEFNHNVNVLILIMSEVIALLFTAFTYGKVILGKKKLHHYLRKDILDLLLSSVILLFIFTENIFLAHRDEQFVRHIKTVYVQALQIYIFLKALIYLILHREKWLYFSKKPVRVMVSSFLNLVIAGTLLLKLPNATTNGIEWIDALFISTSAVCVTGLSTLNLATDFTTFGQVVIMILFQLGGLGILTLTSFAVLLLRRNMYLKDQFMLQEALDQDNINFIGKTLKNIIILTLMTEIIGALTLYLIWENSLSHDTPDVYFHALFHSISAFCNAGFSTFPQGLQAPELANDIPSGFVICALICIGGIGSYTISDLFTVEKNKLSMNRGLSFQSKWILKISFILTFGGAFLIWLCQWSSWQDLPWWQQLHYSMFSSVTCRTAGFSVVEMGDLLYPTLMIMILLMYVGGAPNSTAGGIKVTTLFVLVSYFFSKIKGRSQVHIDWHTISESSIQRALIVFVLSMITIFFTILTLTITDSQFAFEDLVFESISALSTVGVSRGITASFSPLGKLTLTIVMFFGRVGLFTFAFALGGKSQDPVYQYPITNISVG